jgi:EmrB/QacA subfamily drug resistance transporter
MTEPSTTGRRVQAEPAAAPPAPPAPPGSTASASPTGAHPADPTGAPEAGPTDGLSERELRAVFAGLMLGLLLSALDSTIVATAMPTMAGELGGIAYLPWVFTAYLLTSTVTVPIYGKLSDIVGRTVLFKVAIVIFTVGSVAIAASPTMLALVLARGFQGIGAGGLVVLAMTIVADVVPPRQRGRYQGYLTSVFALASISGPLIGGFFVDHASWRWAFLINVPLSGIALFLTSRYLRLPFATRRRSLDVAGALLLTTATVALLMTTVAGEERSWADPWTLGLGGFGMILAVAFLLVERRAAEPMIPLRLFVDRVFRVAISTNLLMGVALFSSTVYLPLYLQVSIGVSATESGLLIMPMTVALLFASIIGGRLVTRFGRYRNLTVVGALLLAAGMAVLATVDADSNRFVVSGAMLLIGTGIGAAMPLLTVAVQNAVRPGDLGVATSMTDFSRKIGGVFGVAALGALLNARVGAAMAEAAADGRIPRRLADAGALLDAPAEILRLAAPVREVIQDAVADGVALLFRIGLVFAVLAVLLALRLEERPLRDTLHPQTAPGDDADDHAPRHVPDMG